MALQQKNAAVKTKPTPKISIVGAGGLGGPIALGLSATLKCDLQIFDPDLIELSNLHRQIQFDTRDIGKPKASVLAEKLIGRGHPEERVSAFNQEFTEATAHLIAAPASRGARQIVIEASDSLEAKFTVNDITKSLSIPTVISALSGYVGHVFQLFPGSACYRCLFESVPDERPTTCATDGVLGPAVGIIAAEAIRLVLDTLEGSSSGPKGTLSSFGDLRQNTTPRIIHFSKRPDCTSCSQTSGSMELRDAV